MGTQQTRLANPLDLKTLLDLAKKDALLATNCHAVATIQSFDPETQTVQAKIAYRPPLFSTDPNAPDILLEYPVLVDVPVVTVSGGQAALTMPISNGDTCLVLFNDRDIDNWFQGMKDGPPATQRLHSFTDGFALVGVRSLQNLIADYDPDRAVLRNGEAMVGVGSALVKISNQTTTLLAVINGLIDIIAAVTTIPTVPGNPATLAPSVIAQLESYKTTVGELLE